MRVWYDTEVVERMAANYEPITPDEVEYEFRG